MANKKFFAEKPSVKNDGRKHPEESLCPVNRLGNDGAKRLPSRLDSDEVVTFETLLKATKSTGEITYDFNYEIEQDDGQISAGFQKKRDEEWCRKAGVVALQTQLQDWFKRRPRRQWFPSPDTYVRNFLAWVREGDKLLGCVEAKGR